MEGIIAVIFHLQVINGGWSVWSAAGQCSRSCGGGVQFKTRTCTNPKPSANGRDCDGATKEIAEKKWCNSQVTSCFEFDRENGYKIAKFQFDGLIYLDIRPTAT